MSARGRGEYLMSKWLSRQDLADRDAKERAAAEADPARYVIDHTCDDCPWGGIDDDGLLCDWIPHGCTEFGWRGDLLDSDEPYLFVPRGGSSPLAYTT